MVWLAWWHGCLAMISRMISLVAACIPCTVQLSARRALNHTSLRKSMQAQTSCHSVQIRAAQELVPPHASLCRPRAHATLCKVVQTVCYGLCRANPYLICKWPRANSRALRECAWQCLHKQSPALQWSIIGMVLAKLL